MAEYLWFAGWLLAVLVLFAAGLRLPALCLSLRSRFARVVAVAVSIGGLVGVTVLANVALTRHDAHFDLTRELWIRVLVLNMPATARLSIRIKSPSGEVVQTKHTIFSSDPDCDSEFVQHGSRAFTFRCCVEHQKSFAANPRRDIRDTPIVLRVDINTHDLIR